MRSRRGTPHGVSERSLRRLWQLIRLGKGELPAAAGKRVVVLSPGNPNHDAGPDFRDALIRIGGVLYRGDVEVHLHSADWRAHGHHRDSRYNGVILHVVLHRSNGNKQRTKSGRTLPLLDLGRAAATSHRKIWEEITMSKPQVRPDTIRCSGRNGRVGARTMRSWLEDLAIERTGIKTRRFRERLTELASSQFLMIRDATSRYGSVSPGLSPEELPAPGSAPSPHDLARRGHWEQLLYEAFMEALGYSKNQAPFLRLARTCTLDRCRGMLARMPAETTVPFRLECLLLNVAGLIPDARYIASPASKRRARLLQKVWIKCRRNYRGEMLAAAEWQFFRLRPENFPTIRIAGAVPIVARFLGEDVLRSIIAALREDPENRAAQLRHIESIFTAPADDFWSSHYQFAGESKVSLRVLIGKQRVRDIVLNAVIPICLLYANCFRDDRVRTAALGLYGYARSIHDNFILRTMQDQLLKGKLRIDSAMLEQGALQLYKNYCTEGRCSACRIGKIVFRKR